MEGKDSEVSLDTLLLAKIADAITMLVYFNSVDGEKGRNRPKSIVEALTRKKDSVEEDKYMTFESIEDYERFMREKRMRKDAEHS